VPERKLVYLVFCFFFDFTGNLSLCLWAAANAATSCASLTLRAAAIVSTIRPSITVIPDAGQTDMALFLSWTWLGKILNQRYPMDFLMSSFYTRERLFMQFAIFQLVASY